MCYSLLDGRRLHAAGVAVRHAKWWYDLEGLQLLWSAAVIVILPFQLCTACATRLEGCWHQSSTVDVLARSCGEPSQRQGLDSHLCGLLLIGHDEV
jgi:hypothetical protein